MTIKCIGCLDLIQEELEMPGKVVVYTCRRFPFSAAISGLTRPGKGILEAVRTCPKRPREGCVICRTAEKQLVYLGGSDSEDCIAAICIDHYRAWSDWLEKHPERRDYLAPKGRSRKTNWIEVFREFIEDMRGTT